MKLKFQDSSRSALRSLAAFTMVEIALSLAVIGFALVAIIGVLPAGMSVQRNNREETLINFDAAFLIDSLRSGSSNVIGLGPNDLTNYVLAITNISTVCDNTGLPDPAFPQRINWFTTTNYSLNGTVVSGNLLTNGAIIVGLLSTPKYILINTQSGYRVVSNLVTADFRTISGAAVDQGASQSSRDFAFSYRVTVEVIPSANFPYSSSVFPYTFFDVTNWQNFASLGNNTISLPPANLLPYYHDMLVAEHMQNNLNEIRLRFRWPVLANGSLGGGRQVYRTIASGINFAATGFPVPKLTNYFMQPQAYQAAHWP